MSSTTRPLVLQRTLPSTLAAYHDLVQEVLTTLQGLGWTDHDLFGVHMALEESISNAVRHGNKEDPDKCVYVECQMSEKRFFAKIRDEGQGYEPGEVPDCCCEENLERPGGRGLKLIEHYMNKVDHSDKGRCLEMEKLLE